MSPPKESFQTCLCSTLDHAVRAWRDRGGSIQEWDPPFGNVDTHKIQIIAERGHLPNHGEVRTARITARSLTIVNLFFYPDRPEAYPVVAMEFVSTEKKGIVAVVDFAGPDELSPLGRRIQMDFSSVANRFSDHDEVPDWYRECRSGFDLFCRPQESSIFEDIGHVFNQHWQSYLDLMMTSPDDPPASLTSFRAGEWISWYKNHHCINSPAWKLFSRNLGDDWTARFLKEHHYR